MKILVASCDKNIDIFDAFHHCMEKYYKGHPEVVYSTETVQNPYYKTISYDIPLNNWTRRIRNTLNDIDDDKILFMIDDCFIRKPVDKKRIKYLCNILDLEEASNIAMFNFEKSFDIRDRQTIIKDFKLREHGSSYEVSLLCGLWKKDKLLKVLDRDCDPWEIELNQMHYGFDYYINSGDFIIDWGYTTWHPAGLFKGKWMREVVSFFEKEGIKIDYEKRGFMS